ncbi:MAG: substrate-binding domain-containing protein [Mycobacteriaceae bacterium]
MTVGEHRSASSKRGISKGPLIAVALVAVLIAGIFSWRAVNNRVNQQGATAAESCVKGPSEVPIMTTPELTEALTSIAARYNEGNSVIRDYCINVTVHEGDSTEVLRSLSDEIPWDEKSLGPQPAAWVAASSLQSNQFTRTKPELVDGQPRSLASSPIILAMPAVAAKNLANSDLSWADLPRLQSDSLALDSHNLSGWGNLRLSLPPSADSDASALAAQAIGTALSGTSPGPLTADLASSAQVARALSQLAVGAPQESPSTTAAALEALSTQSDPKTAVIHAVPTTEQNLVATFKDQQTALGIWSPKGATPIADYPVVRLIAPWLSEEKIRATGSFFEFARQSDQLNILAEAGFRVEGKENSANSVSSFPATSAVLLLPDPTVAHQLSGYLSNPRPGQNTTVLLDISGSMGSTEGSVTRLSAVATALAKRITEMPQYSNIGLWVYSQNLDGTKPYRISVPLGPLTSTEFRQGTRAAAISAALLGLKPATSTATFASILAAYKTAVSNYVSGLNNSVLLITDGPNDDTAITDSSLLSQIQKSTDPSRPVHIDIISIGSNTDRATFQELTAQTRGTLLEIPRTSDKQLADGLAAYLP